MYNVAVLNEMYQIVNAPTVIELWGKPYNLGLVGVFEASMDSHLGTRLSAGGNAPLTGESRSRPRPCSGFLSFASTC